MALGHGENKYEKYGKPTLDLQFSGPKGSISNRADGGAISVEFTRTQDTQASYVKSDGTIGYASTDVARFDHDPTTGESLGLLIEESRTNLALESEDWGNTTYWYQNGNTGGLNGHTGKDFFITTNNTTDTLSPDGANNAVKLAGDTNYTSSGYALGRVSIVTKSITLTQNTVYTFSVFIKDPNSVLDSNQIFYIMYGSMFSNTNASAGFDLQNDTVSFGGDISNQSGSIESYSNGWKKLTATFTNTNNGGAPWIFIQESDNFTGPNTFSTNGESFYAFGFQIEQASSGSSYIPTSGSTSTRGVDTASITGANFSTWYNGSEGSIFIDMKRPAGFSQSGAFLEFFNNAGLFLQDTSGNFTSRIGTENNFITLGDPATTTDYKIASSYQSANDYKVSSNGSSVTSASTAVDFTTATELHIGRGNNAVTAHYRNGPRTLHLKRVTFWPTRLSDSDLQSLTE